MKPKSYVENSHRTAPGIIHVAHHLFAGSFAQSLTREKSGQREPGSPYPGISVCSASELLDFGFENAEILHGREDSNVFP
jgi:hypothetical protein